MDSRSGINSSNPPDAEIGNEKIIFPLWNSPKLILSQRTFLLLKSSYHEPSALQDPTA
jgi:hypothetical protein